MGQPTVQFRLDGVPVLAIQLVLFGLACLALSPVPLALFGATQNLERYSVEKLPADDRALEAWYLDHGARWAIVERPDVPADGPGAEIHIDFRGRGIWRLEQPPLDALGYGDWALRGWERKVLPWKAVPPLLVIAALAWALIRRTVRIVPTEAG